MNKEQEVIAVLDKIRPYIQRDGGDVEFVSLVDDIVTVRMLGACINCLALEDTFTLGIKSMILDEVSGIVDVKMEEVPV